MSASLGIDGLVSGLDTTSLINQLMQAEAAPQTLLKTKQNEAQTVVSALQGLNTRVASLGTTAAKAADAASWKAWTATSSASSVTASAGSGAVASSLTFTVDQVASSQVSVSNAFTDPSEIFATIPPSITVRKNDGTMTTITPATGDLTAITKAINDASDAGVKAVAVRVGSQYRIQFTATSTGQANGFQIFEGDQAAVTAGTATAIPLTSTRAASDASITLWSGSAISQSVSSASNTFSDVLGGVDLTVSAVEAQPVTVDVAVDVPAVSKLASGLVGSLNVVLQEIASRTAVTTTTNSDGTTTVSGGTLSGDSATRNIQQQLMTAASYPINGVSPSKAGITLQQDGTFAFDADVFAKAFAADPAGTQALVSGIAQRVSDASTAISDPYSGSLSLQINGQNDLIKDYGTQIDDWDRRLALRKETLQSTYSALEVTLSNMKSQSSWLASQLSSLSASTA